MSNMSEYKNDVECNCSCHSEEDTILHCMPCCEQCTTCHRNIKTYLFSKHLKECRKVE